MFTSIRKLVVLGAAALAVTVVLTTDAQAQRFIVGRGPVVLPNSQSIINPYYRLTPNLTLNQYAYNVRTLGQAYQSVPPWLFGYNPYPPVVINPVVSTPFVSPYYYGGYAGVYNPYLFYGNLYNPYGAFLYP